MRYISRIARKISSEFLDLPQDVVFDLPRMTMIGNVQLYVENHQGVLDFSSSHLLLKLRVGQLHISGTELVIRTISVAEVFVEGIVKDIRYIQMD